jgi:hypothetical protein
VRARGRGQTVTAGAFVSTSTRDMIVPAASCLHSDGQGDLCLVCWPNKIKRAHAYQPLLTRSSSLPVSRVHPIDPRINRNRNGVQGSAPPRHPSASDVGRRARRRGGANSCVRWTLLFKFFSPFSLLSQLGICPFVATELIL